MKKRMQRIAAFCLAVLLVAGVCWFANGLVGNPISKAIACKTAEAYLSEKYSETDYGVESISYSFKDTCYYAHIVSTGSMDGDFTLRISMLGNLKSDDYDYRVAAHGNVANRLDFAYRDLVDRVLESAAYPYEISIGYGFLEFDREVGEAPVDGALSRAELVNDRFYNVGLLGEKNGRLVLYIDCDKVDEETAAKILLDTKILMDDAGVDFYSVTLVLQYPPYDESSYVRPEGEIHLRDFLYADIYEEGLIERVRISEAETDAYYKAMDEEKLGAIIEE